MQQDADFQVALSTTVLVLVIDSRVPLLFRVLSLSVKAASITCTHKKGMVITTPTNLVDAVSGMSKTGSLV